MATGDAAVYSTSNYGPSHFLELRSIPRDHASSAKPHMLETLELLLQSGAVAPTSSAAWRSDLTDHTK